MNKLQRFFKLKPHKVGIAFGGGALLGAAHIGVLEVFEREGIHPEIVTGTSVGAIIGAAYSAGRSADYMAQMIRSANWANLVKLSFPPPWGCSSLTRWTISFVRTFLGWIFLISPTPSQQSPAISSPVNGW